MLNQSNQSEPPPTIPVQLATDVRISVQFQFRGYYQSITSSFIESGIPAGRWRGSSEINELTK